MDSSTERRRFIIEAEHQIRLMNREVLGPEISGMSQQEIQPVFRMVANARAAYLKHLVHLSKQNENELPSDEDIAALKAARAMFDELVYASQALELAIERGYIGVSSDNP